MTNAFNIQLNHATSHKRHLIQTAATISFEKLHQAILLLFQWKDEEPFHFQIDDTTINWNQKEVHHPLHKWITNRQTILYQYGEGANTRTIQISLQETHSNLVRHIELKDEYIDHQTYRYKQKQLDALHISCLSVDQNMFQELLENIRTECMKINAVAPYLMIFHRGSHTTPYFLDILDNGMELMIFPNETAFAKSILKSDQEDPDLLFTYAYTFDFLFEDIEDCELPLYLHHNLCYKNEPGCLPKAFDEIEFVYAYQLLQDFYQLIKQTKQLPSFGDQEMLVIDVNNSFHTEPLCIKEEVHSLCLNSVDEAHFQSYPHTNERIRLFLQAIPKENSKETSQLDILLCAASASFHKEELVTLQSMDVFGEQVYQFMKQLFKERGLADTILLHSNNLHHFVSGICEQLDINCSLYTNTSEHDQGLLDAICNALCISKEELCYPEITEEQSITKLLS